MPKNRKRLNINRIRSVLYRDYKTRYKFKNWDETLFYGRQVLEELKNRQLTGSKANIKKTVNIIKPSQRKKQKKEEPPLIPEEYLQPKSFWETDLLLTLINNSDKRIFFKSRYFFKGKEIQGGSIVNYEGDFQEWVRNCGKLQREFEMSSSNADLPCWRIDSQPKFLKNKWYAKIISCNQRGFEQDFTLKSFEPGTEILPPIEPIETKIEPSKKIEIEKEPPTIEKEIIRKQKLENLIAYKESIMKDIEFKEKHNRNTDDLWVKFDNVSKQIDDLMRI